MYVLHRLTQLKSPLQNNKMDRNHFDKKNEQCGDNTPNQTFRSQLQARQPPVQSKMSN